MLTLCIRSIACDWQFDAQFSQLYHDEQFIRSKARHCSRKCSQTCNLLLMLYVFALTIQKQQSLGRQESYCCHAVVELYQQQAVPTIAEQFWRAAAKIHQALHLWHAHEHHTQWPQSLAKAMVWLACCNKPIGHGQQSPIIYEVSTWPLRDTCSIMQISKLKADCIPVMKWQAASASTCVHWHQQLCDVHKVSDFTHNSCTAASAS